MRHKDESYLDRRFIPCSHADSNEVPFNSSNSYEIPVTQNSSGKEAFATPNYK